MPGRAGRQKLQEEQAWCRAPRRGRQTAAEEEEGDASAKVRSKSKRRRMGMRKIVEAPATFSFRNTNRLTIFYSTTAFRSLLHSLNKDIISVVPHVNGNTGAISLNVRWRASMEQTVQKGHT